MSTNPVLVWATPLQAAAMAAIHEAAFPPGERWSADSLAIQVGQPGAFGLIDPEGAMVLARVAADEAEILTLATVPLLRRQHRATALLRAALDHARAIGARAMFLEVSETNIAARTLYEEIGFRQVGRRPHYYGQVAALTLRRNLS